MHLCGGCVRVAGYCGLITTHVSTFKFILIRSEGRGHVGAYWFDRCPWHRPVWFWLQQSERRTPERADESFDGRAGRYQQFRGWQGKTMWCPSANMCKHWSSLSNHHNLLRTHTKRHTFTVPVGYGRDSPTSRTVILGMSLSSTAVVS